MLTVIKSKKCLRRGSTNNTAVNVASTLVEETILLTGIPHPFMSKFTYTPANNTVVG